MDGGLVQSCERPIDTRRSADSTDAFTTIRVSKLTERPPADYDCVVGNLASLLVVHDINPDAALGGVLALSPDTDENRGPSFDNIGSTQIHWACRSTGLSVTESGREQPGTESSARIAIGDGYDMPWSPYYGVHHVEHGFLTISDVVAFDAYNTVTEFGDAVPQILGEEWRTVPVERHLYVDVDSTDRAANWLSEPTTSYDSDKVRQYREAIDSATISVEQLATDTWSLARARRVNYRYALAAELAVTDHMLPSIEAWTAASESVYMALRRLRRGRPVPKAFVGAIHNALDVDEALIGVWPR